MLLGLGMTTCEMAYELKISEATVKFHLAKYISPESLTVRKQYLFCWQQDNSALKNKETRALILETFAAAVNEINITNIGYDVF